MVHWDRQAPGVGHDRADRLVDLYSSGEQRNYGSQFLQRKMNISSRAFTDGDFSLTVSDLQVRDSRNPDAGKILEEKIFINITVVKKHRRAKTVVKYATNV